MKFYIGYDDEQNAVFFATKQQMKFEGVNPDTVTELSCDGTKSDIVALLNAFCGGRT